MVNLRKKSFQVILIFFVLNFCLQSFNVLFAEELTSDQLPLGEALASPATQAQPQPVSLPTFVAPLDLAAPQPAAVALPQVSTPPLTAAPAVVQAPEAVVAPATPATSLAKSLSPTRTQSDLDFAKYDAAASSGLINRLSPYNKALFGSYLATAKSDPAKAEARMVALDSLLGQIPAAEPSYDPYDGMTREGYEFWVNVGGPETFPGYAFLLLFGGVGVGLFFAIEAGISDSDDYIKSVAKTLDVHESKLNTAFTNLTFMISKERESRRKDFLKSKLAKIGAILAHFKIDGSEFTDNEEDNNAKRMGVFLGIKEEGLKEINILLRDSQLEDAQKRALIAIKNQLLTLNQGITDSRRMILYGSNSIKKDSKNAVSADSLDKKEVFEKTIDSEIAKEARRFQGQSDDQDEGGRERLDYFDDSSESSRLSSAERRVAKIEEDAAIVAARRKLFLEQEARDEFVKQRHMQQLAAQDSGYPVRLQAPLYQRDMRSNLPQATIVPVAQSPRQRFADSRLIRTRSDSDIQPQRRSR